MRGWSDVLTAYRTLKLLSTGRGGGDLEGGKGSLGGGGKLRALMSMRYDTLRNRTYRDAYLHFYQVLYI